MTSVKSHQFPKSIYQNIKFYSCYKFYLYRELHVGRVDNDFFSHPATCI